VPLGRCVRVGFRQASRRAGPRRVLAGRLPPTPALWKGSRFSGVARPPARRPNVHPPAGRRNRHVNDGHLRPRGCRGDHGGRSGGLAMAYRQYAAALYGLLPLDPHDSGASAGLEGNTFVVAAATLSNLSETSSKLRRGCSPGPQRMPTPHPARNASGTGEAGRPARRLTRRLRWRCG